jgi:mannosyltransferase
VPSDLSAEPRARRGWWWAAAAAIVLGAAARLWTPSELWLDEALTVNIARLPLDRIPDALRHDGAPPLYYLLLHFWMKLFGSGDVAVRMLPGLMAVAALPVMWLAGRRLRGKTTAWWAVLLLACSPFAIRYATENRMYSLTVLLSLLGYLAVMRALEEPSFRWLVAIAVVTGCLVLTHYWAFFVLALVGAALIRRIHRGDGAEPAKRVILAMGAGLIPFLAWVPVFLFQLRHTGTPWAGRPIPGSIVGVLNQFGGGGGWVGPICAVLLLALGALGLFGRNVGRAKVELDLHTRPEGRPLAWVSVGLVVLGVVVGMVTGSGFPGRYASLVLPFFLLLAVLGLLTLGSRTAACGTWWFSLS